MVIHCLSLYLSSRLAGHNQSSSGDESPVRPDGFHHDLCPACHHRCFLAHVPGDGTERTAGLVKPQHEYPVILVGEVPPEEFLYVPYQPVAPGKHIFPLLYLFRAVRLTQS